MLQTSDDGKSRLVFHSKEEHSLCRQTELRFMQQSALGFAFSEHHASNESYILAGRCFSYTEEAFLS